MQLLADIHTHREVMTSTNRGPTRSAEPGHFIGFSEMTTTENLPQLTIIYRSLSEIIPHARNARTHSDAQVQQIADSITEFGWTNPVLIDESGGLIAGHGRVMAAESLGLDQVPAIQLTDLTENQKRAYRLADNRLPLNAGWDEELLRSEIQLLDEEGFDLALTGFADEEINNLLGDELDIDFDKDEDSGGVDISYLSFCRKKIPMTEAEESALLGALTSYTDERGSFFGFVSSLLGVPNA